MIQTGFPCAIQVPPLVTAGKINLTPNQGRQTEVLQITLIVGNCTTAWITWHYKYRQKGDSFRKKESEKSEFVCYRNHMEERELRSRTLVVTTEKSSKTEVEETVCQIVLFI